MFTDLVMGTTLTPSSVAWLYLIYAGFATDSVIFLSGMVDCTRPVRRQHSPRIYEYTDSSNVSWDYTLNAGPGAGSKS